MLGLVLGGNHTLRRGHPGPLGTALLSLSPLPTHKKQNDTPSREMALDVTGILALDVTGATEWRVHARAAVVFEKSSKTVRKWFEP